MRAGQMGRMLRTSCTFFAVGVWCWAHGQQWEVHNMDNAGFPSNTVVDIAEDGAGVLWAATDWGLCRLENGVWTVIQQQPDGLPSNSLTCLAVDTTDRLWVGTISNGIGVFDGTSWTYLNNTNSPILTEGVRDILHDHRGWVWISTELGLHVFTGTDWFLYDNTAQSHQGYTFFGPNVRSVAVREDGLVAVATLNAGLTYLSETDFIYYTASNSNFPDNSQNAVAFDGNGDRWLACPSGGLIWHSGEHVGGPWFQYNAFTSGFPNNTLLCLAIDTIGHKWVGSETMGVLVFEGPGSWYLLNAANSGLPDDHVRSILVDQEGNIWVGTNTGGLARFVIDTGMETPTAAQPRVFPNPFHDRIHLDLSDRPGTFTWELNDLLGRTLQRGTMAGGALVPLDLQGLVPGNHLLRLSDGDRSHTLWITRMHGIR